MRQLDPVGTARAPAHVNAPPPAGARERAVSRETLAQPESAGRKYVSPFRRNQGERTRAALVDATLSFVRQGCFRPEAREIAEVAGCHKSAVTRHFGSLDLLYRVIARGHWSEVLLAAGIDDCHDRRHIDLAWLIMVGRPRDLS
jgi:AcrR family transcriptional regulator